MRRSKGYRHKRTAPASVDDENGTVSDMPDIDATPSETGLGTDGEDEGDDKRYPNMIHPLLRNMKMTAVGS